MFLLTPRSKTPTGVVVQNYFSRVGATLALSIHMAGFIIRSLCVCVSIGIHLLPNRQYSLKLISPSSTWGLMLMLPDKESWNFFPETLLEAVGLSTFKDPEIYLLMFILDDVLLVAETAVEDVTSRVLCFLPLPFLSRLRVIRKCLCSFESEWSFLINRSCRNS